LWSVFEIDGGRNRKEYGLVWELGKRRDYEK
jgi:hypothetical protein